jgi:hypothetical protein
VRVTGTAQREAWLARTPPPVEQVRPDLWSVPVPIPDSPLRYTLSGSAFSVAVGFSGRRVFVAGFRLLPVNGVSKSGVRTSAVS